MGPWMALVVVTAVHLTISIKHRMKQSGVESRSQRSNLSIRALNLPIVQGDQINFQQQPCPTEIKFKHF